MLLTSHYYHYYLHVDHLVKFPPKKNKKIIYNNIYELPPPHSASGVFALVDGRKNATSAKLQYQDHLGHKYSRVGCSNQMQFAQQYPCASCTWLLPLSSQENDISNPTISSISNYIHVQ